jgi:hypothetical protein
MVNLTNDMQYAMLTCARGANRPDLLQRVRRQQLGQPAAVTRVTGSRVCVQLDAVRNILSPRVLHFAHSSRQQRLGQATGTCTSQITSRLCLSNSWLIIKWYERRRSAATACAQSSVTAVMLSHADNMTAALVLHAWCTHHATRHHCLAMK